MGAKKNQTEPPTDRELDADPEKVSQGEVELEEEEEIEFPVRVDLRSPLKHGKRDITFLELNEPTAGDMLDLKMGEEFGMADMLKMIGRCAGVPPSVCKQLKPHDLDTLSEWIGRFLAPLRPPQKSDADLDS